MNKHYSCQDMCLVLMGDSKELQIIIQLQGGKFLNG
jgi:hypothetical protein